MNTRRFAKRQMTWFKRTENATWFDYAIDRTEIFKHIEKQLKK
jgi:tRNA dimethylallyltransferase